MVINIVTFSLTFIWFNAERFIGNLPINILQKIINTSKTVKKFEI